MAWPTSPDLFFANDGAEGSGGGRPEDYHLSVLLDFRLGEEDAG